MIIICMQSDSPINMIITYVTTFLFMYYTAFVSYSLLYILWCMSVVSVCVYNRLTSINLRGPVTRNLLRYDASRILMSSYMATIVLASLDKT